MCIKGVEILGLVKRDEIPESVIESKYKPIYEAAQKMKTTDAWEVKIDEKDSDALATYDSIVQSLRQQRLDKVLQAVKRGNRVFLVKRTE